MMISRVIFRSEAESDQQRRGGSPEHLRGEALLRINANPLSAFVT